MFLYHGTAFDRSFTGEKDIKLIGTGEFGSNSFYLSFTPQEAKFRAYLNAQQGIGNIKDTRVMKFDLDESKVNIKNFGDYSVEWLEFLYTHEIEGNPDVIIGGLVDEMGNNPGLLQEWQQNRKFGEISDQYTKSVITRLKTDIKYQIAVKTQKGLDALNLIEVIEV